MGRAFGPRHGVLAALIYAAFAGAAWAQSTAGGAGKTVRLIAPELIAPAPSSGGLQRLPALLPPPVAKKAVKRSVVGNAAHFRLLPLPIAEAAGLFVADGYRIALAGIGPPDRDEKCGDGWPCGALALTAFRAYMRGRSLRCRVPDDRPSGTEIIVTSCFLGGRDIAAWLVEQGWARRSGEAYAAEDLAAQSHRRGVYGTAPSAYASSLPSISAQVSGTP